MTVTGHFFSPEGKPISKESFLDFYNECYYLNNSRRIEIEIERLLKEGIKNRKDIIHLLAWKMNGINHKKSQASSKKAVDFRYNNTEKWCDDNNQEKAAHRGRNIEKIQDLSQNICNNLSRWETQDPQTILNELNKFLNDKKIKYIGTVYLLTLLYFISRGKNPIYDQFAMVALKAIQDIRVKEPGDPISYNPLPNRNSTSFGGIIASKDYQEYLIMLRKQFFDDYYVFGTDIERERKVDRALWTYGHLFDVTDKEDSNA